MSHKDCDDALASLYQYLDDELDSLSATEIKSHLNECNGCSKFFNFEARLKVVVRERLAEDVPDEIIQRVRTVIQAERDNC